MSLSRTQKALLDKCEVPEDLQEYMGRQLDMDGLPLELNAPDFLMILIDHLKASESLLSAKRYELMHIESGQLPFPNPDVAQAAIDHVEQRIKTEWLFSSSLWRAVDKVASHAADYGVSLQPLHVQYAIDRKILSALEILRYAKPEFFNLKSLPQFRYFICFCFGLVVGAVFGPVAGFMGAIRECMQEKQGLEFAWSIVVYPLWGILTGCAMGGLTGARIGRETGDLGTTWQLAVRAAYLNPFHEPPGTKNQQEAEFVIQETLFHLASEEF